MADVICAGSRHVALRTLTSGLREQGVPPAEAEMQVRATWTYCAQPEGNLFPLREALDVLEDLYRGYDTPAVLVDVEVPSWLPEDLEPALSGTSEQEVASLFVRSDGQGLFYPGLTHSLHGESESGKSLVMQIECAKLLAAGEKVLYIDFESDARSVVGRILSFGATAEDIRVNLSYIRPAVDPRVVAAERMAWEQLLSRRFALAVIDGVTDAFHVFGYATKDNDAITAFNREVPRVLADRTGAAVVMLDHVTKDKGSRGRFAIGGQAKMNALTGAAYTIEVAEPLGFGLRGIVVLRMAKDRPGSLRIACGAPRASDRTQEAARVVVDATAAATRVTVEPPQYSPGTTSSRPTALMERASIIVEIHGPITKNALVQRMECQKQVGLLAIDILVAEGYMRRSTGPNNAQIHDFLRAYHEIHDPESEPHDSEFEWDS